ncbi:MAG: hypothetical protein GY898_29760 [Proteobacteria bacterium]|nr:hypothetical protein [Pseudomonadota bacterium]
MVDSNQLLGPIGGFALLAFVVLLLMTGGGTHAASDPLLCARIEAEWDRCVVDDVNGDGHCSRIGEQAMTCRVSLQGGSTEPQARNDWL